MDSTQPFILTLQMNALLQQTLNALRQTYFPPERNHLQAHITLFHALPAEYAGQIKADLQEITHASSRFDLHLDTLRFLGKGIAINVSDVPLLTLRKELANRWQAMLFNQDRQRFSPHVTIQNKVDPKVARQTFETLNQEWVALTGQATGLELWRYKGGPWTFEDRRMED